MRLLRFILIALYVLVIPPLVAGILADSALGPGAILSGFLALVVFTSIRATKLLMEAMNSVPAPAKRTTGGSSGGTPKSHPDCEACNDLAHKIDRQLRSLGETMKQEVARRNKEDLEAVRGALAECPPDNHPVMKIIHREGNDR